MLLAACANVPATEPPQRLFSDDLFLAPSERIRAEDVFAISAEMKSYLETEFAREDHGKDRRRALFDALYRKGGLKLEYDLAITRNAAQTFEARSGNCLSLVIMTAAFAKELGLPVRYQSAYMDDTWSRSGGVQFFVGHVNLNLARALADRASTRSGFDDELTIDFLPPLEIRGLRTREIGEKTIIAMYMNNRAAEALARGELDDGYSWARAAITQDPGFLTAYNTLGVIYQRHGNVAEAERALAFALERDPRNTHVMSNMVVVLNAEGRVEEAKALTRKLEQIEPNPPFAYFYRGLKAMTVKDYKTARDLFATEAGRAPYYHEFHFWLAAAYLGLGDSEQARKELRLAIEYSTTRNERDLYAAKLERITSHWQK